MKKTHTTDHRLAAIIFTDIVGYTATMQSSENQASLQVAKHEQAVKESAAFYGGDVLQFYGDGSLSIFDSVTDAIECAGKVQQKMKEEPAVPLRIGIHLGEIYFTGGKFLGDGINIASRIQSEAGVGEVFVSDTVFQMARNKENFRFEEVGIRSLKNVLHPVKVHRVHVTKFSEGIKSKEKTGIGKHIKWAGIGALGVLIVWLGISRIFPDQQIKTNTSSMMVLPFQDQGTQSEQLLFGSAVADEVRSLLAGIQKLDVRSPASSKFVSNQNWSAREIADELDVDYLLGGSCIYAEDRLVLKLTLTDTNLDQVVQNINYETFRSEDFVRTQNEIAQAVIDALQIEVRPQEVEKIARLQTENLEAYKLYMMGRHFALEGYSQSNLEKSADAFRQAIEKDPTYAKAYAGLAEVLMYPAGFGWERVSDGLKKATPYARRAYELDPDLAESNCALGHIDLHSENFRAAEPMFLKTIQLDPTIELPHIYMAYIKSARGDVESALEYTRNGRLLNPFSPLVKGQTLVALLMADRFTETITAADSFLVEHPNDPFLLWNKGIAQTMLGQIDEGIETFLERPIPNREYNFALGYAYAVQGERGKAEEILNYLLEKSIEGYVPPSNLACIYMGLGDMGKVYEWLPQEELFILKMYPWFTHLRNDPRLRQAFAFLRERPD